MADFTMQTQKEDKWCWAAVTVSINNFLDPQAVPAWTQATLATKVLGPPPGEGKILATVDCSLTPDQCDFPAALTDALTATGNLSGDPLLGPLPFASLTESIDDNLPVCAQIDWFSGGAHAVALDGYRTYTSGAQAVLVQDPLYKSGFHFYDDLVNNYPPGGKWAATFLVKA
jgi:hypothetical protein